MAIGIPLQIAFIDTMELMFIFEIISVIIQILVVFVTFRTPVMVKGGFTLGFVPILKNYLNNGMFYDIFGLLPMNLVLI